MVILGIGGGLSAEIRQSIGGGDIVLARGAVLLAFRQLIFLLFC